LHAL